VLKGEILEKADWRFLGEQRFPERRVRERGETKMVAPELRRK
jgi:hypothetical protein